jgi:general stress protein YciG
MSRQLNPDPSVTSSSASSSEPTRAHGKQRRGFAVLSPERQREIASMGGRTAHALGHAHKYTSEEARDAGRKGGVTVSRDSDYMATIGRRGGQQRSHRIRTATIGERAEYRDA